jgi:hypothetical protein
VSVIDEKKIFQQKSISFVEDYLLKSVHKRLENMHMLRLYYGLCKRNCNFRAAKQTFGFAALSVLSSLGRTEQ